MSYNPYSLDGKTILITGASSGIGRATAIECSKSGAKLILTGRNEQRLLETISLLNKNKNHLHIVADLADEDEVIKLVDFLPEINGCVNNAGFNVLELINFIKKDTVDKILNVNTKAPILLTNLLVKKKKVLKNSSIVFVSSISGTSVCSIGNSLYSASKGAITSFMKNAALDLASKKIRCNAVLPGMVETPLMQAKSMITEEQWNKNLKTYPLGRFGKPNDIAYAIIYFLSDASDWATGSTLIVDGGRTLV